MNDQVSETESELSGLLGKLQRLARRFGEWWRRYHEALLVLRPAWLAVIVSIAVTAALQVPQARDSLKDLDLMSWPQWVLLFAAVTMAASAWYFPRAMLYVRYSFTPSRPTEERADHRFEPLRRWAPRALGALPLLSLVVASGRAGKWGLVVLYLVVTAAGLYLVQNRWRWIRDDREHQVRHGSEVGLVDRLPPATYRWVLRLLILAGAMLLLFILVKVRIPQLAGPLGILFVAAAVWIAVGSMLLVYPTSKYTVPSLVVISLLAAALFSLWNDNHQVRRLDKEAGGSWHRDDAATYFHEWLDARSDGWRARAGKDKEFPVVVVAAEGGGIRAGYWTAAVLAVLEDRIPGFACHVFAISGVSGGSLGAAVFAAQIAERLDGDPDYVCDGRALKASNGAFLDEATSVLDDDFLGPALAGLLFPDLLQRFLPLWGDWSLPDRAVYLEKAWERGWLRREGAGRPDEGGKGRFGESFRQLWNGHERHDPDLPGARGVSGEPPSLFLNGAWVEDGGRNLTSNLSVAGDSHFVELDDVLARLEHPIRLSTAVHNSARFTYVSPAGTIGKGATTRRIVDGGYFEVSGGSTGAEIVRMIEDECYPEPADAPESKGEGEETSEPEPAETASETPCSLEVNILALYVRNSREEKMNGKSRSLVPLSETLSPVKALLNSRGARGRLAVEEFEQSVAGHGAYHYIPLPDVAPLGWALSEDVRNAMDDAAAGHEEVPKLIKVFEEAQKPVSSESE